MSLDANFASDLHDLRYDEVLAVTYHQDFLITYVGDRLKVEARHAIYRCQKDTTTVSVMDPI